MGPQNAQLTTPATTRPKRSIGRKLAITLGFLVWLGILGGIFYNRQSIQDWYALRGYQAPAAVATIATQDTMTGYARKVLYVNKPQLETKTQFTQCGARMEQTIVLGCYHSDQAGIFVLTVTDPRLNGVEQVTTAHEMLHASYDRLSASERQKVNDMLQDYYDHDLHDQRIIDTLNGYKTTEPHDVVNEMHSIFGTEIKNLPAPLEQYYKRYFTNRQVVAGFAQQYEEEFTSRKTAIKQDDAQLSDLKNQITQQEIALNSKNADLQNQQAQLKTSRDAGDIAGYNQGVPVYNQLVNAYNDQVATVKSLIDQYNQLVNERNKIALEAQALQNAISSQPTTISQ